VTVPILNVATIEARRNENRSLQRILFRVAALYGLSRHSVEFPLNERESVDSGQISVTIDPDADHSSNVGLINYSDRSLTVRYGVQAVFPGLCELVTRGGHDASLLNPVRIVATDTCTLTSGFTGWHAIGCLDFLPGSLWAGAGGG
jgi:hypothetical protein